MDTIEHFFADEIFQRFLGELNNEDIYFFRNSSREVQKFILEAFLRLDQSWKGGLEGYLGQNLIWEILGRLAYMYELPESGGFGNYREPFQTIRLVDDEDGNRIFLFGTNIPGEPQSFEYLGHAVVQGGKEMVFDRNSEPIVDAINSLLSYRKVARNGDRADVWAEEASASPHAHRLPASHYDGMRHLNAMKQQPISGGMGEEDAILDKCLMGRPGAAGDPGTKGTVARFAPGDIHHVIAKGTH